MIHIKQAVLEAFRCFDKVDLELSHINIFAGPNNSGKSALLAAIRRLPSINLERHPRDPQGGGFLGSFTDLKLQHDDIQDNKSPARLGLTVSKTARIQEAMQTMKIGRKHGRYSKTEVLLQDAYWPFTVVARFAEERVKMLELVQHDRMPPEEELPENERIGLAGTILELIEALPIVVLPERRDCGPEAGKTNGIREERIDASVLLSELIDMYCVDQSRFKGFVCRLGELAGMSARITLHPRERQLKLSLGNESARSVENLGAGVLELMMLSLALEKYNGGLLLYEEPELHLHPTLQRSVMRMLKKECVDGSWQSLVTTHSNHILDLEMKEGVATHIVKRTSAASCITTINKNEMRDAVELLGVRPSSLQEANALIWVEGPSDAIYLRFFIEVASRRRDIKLEEFMDFSFAFFGGALLAHMRLTVEPVDGFISLLSIHPGSYLILDSDRKPDMPELGKLYARNFIENSDYRDRIWVTQGKEIEDYLPSHIAAGVIPRIRNDINKVKTAREAVQQMEGDRDFDWLADGHLGEQLNKLINFIVSRQFGSSALCHQTEPRLSQKE